MGFAPFGEPWRWRGEIDVRAVIIEFLCDRDSVPEGEAVRPSGCTEVW
jgi:hypothetical protein